MKQTKTRPSSGKKNISKLQRACERAVHFDGLEERRLMTATFTVTCAADSGPGTLREAICLANGTAGPDVVKFDIGGGGAVQIELASALPASTGPITIDGTSQGGFAGTPLVWVDGSMGVDDMGNPTFAGLQIEGGASVVRGLALTGFKGAIDLSGGANDSVTGCIIGFDSTAAEPDSSFSNHDFGIAVRNSGSTIGGVGAGDANVISLNNDDGILVDGGSNATILGNLIGTDATGSMAPGNGNNGIRLHDAAGVTIGGLLAGEGNIIGGNFGNGITIDASSGIQVLGNFIGANPAASDAFLSNFGDGIFVSNVTPPSGTTPQVLIDSNLISSNFGDGIRLHDASGVTVTRNVIGSTQGPELGNNGDGIGLEGTSSGNRIGGTGTGEGNTIANNLSSGIAIYVADDPAESGVGNAIRGNEIHDNLSIGIDLTEIPGIRGFDVLTGLGPTPNDSAATGHVGPNKYQNFPVMGSTSRLGTTVTVHGSLSAAASSDYSIDLFGNQFASSSGYGEGEFYLDTITVHTDAAGHASFTHPISNVDAKYVVFTATATDANGNTSEFSQVNEAVAVASTTTLATSLNPSTYGMSVTFTATVTGSGVGTPGGDVTFMDGAQVLGTETLNASGIATFTTDTLTAANHAIRAVYGGDGQYASSSSAVLSQNVMPKALTVTVGNASKVYGQANPANYGLSYAGFVPGQDSSVVMGTPVFATSADDSSGAGSYAVHVSGLSAANYAINYVDGSLSVTKAALTITAQNKSATYGAPTPTLTASYSGFVNGDTFASLTTPVSLATTASAGSDVGSYPITASGATSGNYDITFVGGTLAISQASLTITAGSGSKVYGSPNPALGISYDGFVNGDTVASLTSAASVSTAANAASHAGSYAVTASGAASGNYAISYVPGALTVTPAALTVSVANTTKSYGQPNPPFTLNYSGFKNLDDATSLVGAPLVLCGADSTSPVGSYGVSVGGLSSSDYTITFQDGTLAVTPAALTISVNNGTRAYGLANPPFDVTYSSCVNGDSAASLGGAAVFSTAATAASHVGAYSVTASGLTSTNYNISYAGGTLTIVQAGTTTALASSASSSNSGQAVTFTATVSGSPGFVPSGMVTFTDNGNSVATATLVNGVATWTISTLAAGSHTIVAMYAGSGDYIASNSSPLAQSVTAGVTISGTAYTDLTGNGLSDDDTPLAGVTVNLYADTDHNGVLSSGDQVVAHMVSGADGAYAFATKAGLYFVGEMTPAGYLQTGPATPMYYTVSAASGGTSIENDFDNFLADCDVHDVTNVSYLINGTTVVDQLRGSVHQGDTVEVIFTVPAGETPHRFSFVTYTAPGSTFDADFAHQQMVYDSDSGVSGPGVHTLTVTVPDAYFQIDFVCGEIIDHLGPAGSNIFYTPQGRLIGADNGGTQAPINAPSSISGFIYLDANNNGSIDLVDGVIAGVKVTLSGTDDKGKAVSMVEFTDSDGRYFFGGLRPGTYAVVETQPTGASDGKETLGSIAGSATSTFGTASNERFSNIKLAASRDGVNYNFGETGCAVHHGQTAAIGFWQNSSGQSLLKSLNNGSSDTNLGIWLAASFPNLYGQNAGAASLVGKTNAQIAAFYTTLYKTTAQKLDAQVLALAFATYVTDAQLAGTVAQGYGLEVTDAGVGAATYNVGSNGAAFGVANNSTVAVSELLQIADNRSWNGTLWDSDHTGTLSATETAWRNMAYTIFNSINNAGGL